MQITYVNYMLKGVHLVKSTLHVIQCDSAMRVVSQLASLSVISHSMGCVIRYVWVPVSGALVKCVRSASAVRSTVPY